jgi:hypothetical protein
VVALTNSGRPEESIVGVVLYSTNPALTTPRRESALAALSGTRSREMPAPLSEEISSTKLESASWKSRASWKSGRSVNIRIRCANAASMRCTRPARSRGT